MLVFIVIDWSIWRTGTNKQKISRLTVHDFPPSQEIKVISLLN